MLTLPQAKGLRTNKTLRELDLTQNNITQRGIDYILAALRGEGEDEGKNETLLTLRSSSWGITRNDVAQVRGEQLTLLLCNV